MPNCYSAQTTLQVEPSFRNLWNLKTVSVSGLQNSVCVRQVNMMSVENLGLSVAQPTAVYFIGSKYERI